MQLIKTVDKLNIDGGFEEWRVKFQYYQAKKVSYLRIKGEN